MKPRDSLTTCSQNSSPRESLPRRPAPLPDALSIGEFSAGTAFRSYRGNADRAHRPPALGTVNLPLSIVKIRFCYRGRFVIAASESVLKMPSIARGTDGSNPSPSSGESRANLTSGAPLSSAAAPQLSFSKQLGRASESSARLVWSLESGRRRFGHCDAMPKAKARGDIIGTSSRMPGHVIVRRKATRRHIQTKTRGYAADEPTRVDTR